MGGSVKISYAEVLFGRWVKGIRPKRADLNFEFQVGFRL